MSASPPCGSFLVLCLFILSPFSPAQSLATEHGRSGPREVQDLRIEPFGIWLDLNWPSVGPCVTIYASSSPWEGFLAVNDPVLFEDQGRTHYVYSPRGQEERYFRVSQNLAPVASVAEETHPVLDFFSPLVFHADPDGDPEGETLSFRWEHADGELRFGPTLVLEAPLEAGVSHWTLTVNDGCQDSEALPLVLTYLDPLPDGVCVSPNGSDAHPGSWDLPLASIGEALARVTEETPNVYLCQGEWQEDLVLVDHARLLGGYSPDFRQRDWQVWPSRVRSLQSGRAVYAEGRSSLFLEGLHLVGDGLQPETHGLGRYGAQFVACEWVQVQFCVLESLGGLPGASGQAGEAGNGSAPGQPGMPGCENGSTDCASCLQPAGGAGGSGAFPGGAGGNGGLGTNPGLDGEGNGSGTGGGTAANGLDGADGEAGTDGSEGAPGSGIWAESFLPAGPVSGEDGLPGLPGSGGGGGGGGVSGCPSYGSSGGGGGGSGAGGSGGQGGQSGGGAFSAYFHSCENSTLRFCTLLSGPGGAGGDGGAGGLGGEGGRGGPGGVYGEASGQDDAGLGGHGGDGGNGGNGGHGAPGNGGPAYLIVDIDCRINTLGNSGLPAPGGAPGTNPSGAMGEAGGSGFRY